MGQPANPGSLGQMAVKTVCVCVCYISIVLTDTTRWLTTYLYAYTCMCILTDTTQWLKTYLYAYTYVYSDLHHPVAEDIPICLYICVF